jgi:hypothetical protein
MKYINLVPSLLLFVGCQSNKNSPLLKVLSSDVPAIKKVMSEPDKYEVQILFTEVNRDDPTQITFKDYEYHVNDHMYFYPASTVKLPTALFALEKITKFKKIGRYNPFKIEGDSIETNISEEIRKVLLISDNEAYNRLFEFVGKDAINARLKELGIKGRISHRLSTPNADDLTSKLISFRAADTTAIIPSRENKPIEPLSLKSLQKGKGYIENGELISEPKDFSKKNYLPIRSLHRIVKRLIFPNAYKEEQRFQLRPNERLAFINTMGLVPGKYGYNLKKYPDNYGKFFVIGDIEGRKPNDIHIYNKVGCAYGYLIDCAYIYNQKTEKDYILTAVIQVNENGIFNDDQYEYDEIGIPFLAELGRQLVHHSGKTEE